MKLFARKVVLLPVVLAGTFAVGMPQVQAQSLFEHLFGGGVRNQRMDDSGYIRRSGRSGDGQYDGEGDGYRFGKRPARPVARKPAAVSKISAPSYYNYKAPALQRVDFTPLAAIGQSASLDQATAGTAFREAVTGLSGYELFAEPEIAKALVEYYSDKPDFIWVTGNEVNERGRDAVRVLGEADSHGLSPADYAISVPSASMSAGDAAARKSELIRFEMALSARVLRYAHDAEGGRINPNKLSGYHDFPEKPFDMVDALKVLSLATDVRGWLEARHPNNDEYNALRVELEALKASSENDIVVDPKLLLKPGQTNPELGKLLHLIARDLDDEMGGDYGELLARTVNSETYGQELVPVVKASQTRAGLTADGVIGPRTVAALAGTSKAERIDKVLVALEQLRWLPRDLGETRVFINQPAFTARFIDKGVEKLNMRAVVGKPSNQTSFFYDEIEQVDYNPYWGVPQSIIVNEMLPRLRNDPGYLDRAGYEVTDAKGRSISSSAINWWAYGSKVPYNVRQTPSEANALGELKILFPNKHAIYMHDTPQKALFDRDMRAFSHGCVRLKDPRGMAAAVLGTTVEHIEAKLKQGHSTEKTTLKIPVYVAYFTAWPDKHGKIEYFGDVYERDARVKLAMEKTDAVRVPSS
ncbi:L,D-transpeptidase family protein [Mesorhizobium sp. KR9-304]|uniref:L,D-transpeptidase family protein n=1 Tax=Mesorhizobium sp. KR9-304 TaxID=3156614 RepID=UPI0032B4787D